MPFKIFNVVGARPQFVKAAPLSKLLSNDIAFEEILIHTGQHYDYNLSQSFFEALEIKNPDYNLQVGSGRHIQQMAEIMQKLDLLVEKEAPQALIVYGDTNSTAAAAIVAAKNNVPLLHVEAGLREWNKNIPEEINKLLTDAVTDVYFSPTQTGVDNLMASGIRDNVWLTGDVALDLVYQNQTKIDSMKEAVLAKYDTSPQQYVYVTLHRAANTENVNNLKNILFALHEIDMIKIFPMHPRTAKVIKDNGMQYLLEDDKFKVIEPLQFWENQVLIKNAYQCLTDSGGVIKEAYFHHIPCIVFDKQTEWMEAVNEGWTHIAGPDKEKIIYLYHHISKPEFHGNSLGDGKVAERIIEIIKKVFHV
ncbi:MAG: UDP-N-acetylglucosamine 2-epimerase (non-hydrolyzing) [Saprospiraceae bacterium]|nr:UDP-N-acetylglucosamine 2-epimerase (non-hydrolyzing) [Saprospiraceae bacterium]